MLPRIIGLVFTLLLFVTPVLAGDEPPAWLQQVAKVTAPAYENDVPAVVLQKEQHVTVSADGRITTVSTYAIRVLVREGRQYAVAREFYESDGGKVRDMHAWLIRPSGQIKKYGKDEVIDAIEDADDVYNESRVKIIDASDDADTGCVFGYETTTEQRSIFSQDVWSFQDRLPTLLSRYVLTVPDGWHAKGVTFNHPDIEPAMGGSVYTWELRNLAPINLEPSSPQVSSLVPRLAVSFYPKGDTQPTSLQTFANWAEVSHWLSELHDPQAVADEPLAAKTRALTANATTELDKIRAIGRFVQSIKYISIDIGVSRGGGMRPHSAAQVFAKSYGDCKDKANLMRAMLKVVNITSYPVAIFSGDASYVREEWPSPHQFNHCIIAIKVADETQSATVIRHATLGRLLIFDATDEHTPVGDLPDEEQGSFALIAAGDAGALMRMPTMAPESSRLDREADVVLTADGAITAILKEQSVGQTAVGERRMFHSLSNTNYRGMVERWVTRGANAAQITKVAPVDSSEGKFDLSVDFSALNYGQLMQGRLLVFKPAIIARRESLFLTDTKRSQAVVLDARAFNETVRFKLPAGFDVDELPDAVKLDTPFGVYSTSYEVKDGQLTFKRALAQRAVTIPVAQYAAVRTFFEKIRAAEQAPVVLAKK
ncbi:MAG: hypothetical protein QOD75_920 [Blastocatellia bacterium]|nr:hypothetical protein [Blastocatellia bacterium]